MKVTSKQVKDHRDMLLNKLRDYVPQTFSEKFGHVAFGYGFFALFPLMSTQYPSAMFLANVSLGLLMFIQLCALCVMTFTLQFMRQMPNDVRKMQYTLLGDEKHRILNLIFGPLLVYTLFACGFPVFAAIIGIFSVSLFVVNSKYRNLCNVGTV
jgi:uncharacterized protein YacL